MTRLFAGTPFDRPPKCEACGELVQACVCPPPEPERVPPQRQRVKIAIEKRKRGKVVTALRGLSAEGGTADLLSRLKSVCGAGGTFKDGILEIQGDHGDRVRATLSQLGYRVDG
ncbi:MAG TPA: translation initiation factor [Planctomycetaceae bacterium]|nr:translation initiation factor [Planctomycetaceae bacterium]